MSTICFYARYEDAAGDGVNGIAVTWDVERITRSDGTRSALVTGGATSITVGRRGLYGYVLTNADLTTYDYVATAITADSTPTAHEVAAIWTLWSLSWYDVDTSIMTIVGSIGYLLVNNLDGKISDIAKYVWQYSIRTLTVGLAHLKTALLGTKIEIFRGDTLILDIPGLGDLSAVTNIWFTVKKSKTSEDSASEIQVDKNTGLLYIVGTTGTPANGSITITDVTKGNITVTVEAVETAKLSDNFNGYFDVQTDTGSIIATKRHGNARIIGDVTRATA